MAFGGTFGGLRRGRRQDTRQHPWQAAPPGVLGMPVPFPQSLGNAAGFRVLPMEDLLALARSRVAPAP